MEQDLEMDDFITECKQIARRQLVEEGEVSSLAFFRPRRMPDGSPGYNSDGTPIMGSIAGDMFPSKELWYKALGGIVKKLNAKFVVMVAESWVSVDAKDGSEGYPIPSQDPNRKEAIVIMGIEYDTAGIITRKSMATLYFSKENGEYVFPDDGFSVVESGLGGTIIHSPIADITARDDLA